MATKRSYRNNPAYIRNSAIVNNALREMARKIDTAASNREQKDALLKGLHRGLTELRDSLQKAQRK